MKDITNKIVKDIISESDYNEDDQRFRFRPHSPHRIIIRKDQLDYSISIRKYMIETYGIHEDSELRRISDIVIKKLRS